MRTPMLLLTVAVMAAATVAIRAAQTTAPVDREAAWRQDLDAFTREFRARQLDFDKLYPRATFDTAVDTIRRDLSRMSDPAITLALMRIVASARVGHNVMMTPAGRTMFRRLPLGLAWYSDGLMLSAAPEAHRAAIGLKVARIGRLAPDELLRAVAPYVSYELDNWLRLQSTSLMLVHELLAALGQTEPDGRVRIVLERPGGLTMEMMIAAHEGPQPAVLIGATAALGIPVPLARSKPNSSYWYKRLPDRRGLFVQYNRCRDDPDKPFAAFAAELFADADAHKDEIERVIVDLRYNGGGDSRIIAPLVKGLRDRKYLSEKGRMFALIGAGTFSSGVMAAMDMRSLKAVLVGEPAGEALNSYGEVRPFTLPNSRLVLQYTTKFFKLGKGAELEPDVRVPRTLADALKGRDAAMERALVRPR